MPVNDLGQPIGHGLPGWQPPPTPPRAPLSGRFVRLEPLHPDHHARGLYDAFALDADGRNWTYLPYGPFTTFDDLDQWLCSIASAADPLFFTIIEIATGLPAGLASFCRIQPNDGSVEVGHIHYSERIKHTPAATETMFLMMRTAFDLGYRRYEWKCDSLNAASRAAAQRLGFSFEGIFRNATVRKDRNRDTAWFAITDDDWPKLHKAFQTWLDPSNFDAQGKQKSSLSALTQSLLHAGPHDS